jgi:hypothetical protein
MGAREDVLAAARSLVDRGITVFSPAQLIAETKSRGTAHPESTLRTFIVGPMCVNSPVNHAVQYPDLERIDRGCTAGSRLRPRRAPLLRLRLSRHPRPRAFRPRNQPGGLPGEAREEWFWEGNVQARVVSHLAATGWQIRRVAGTASGEHGVDIEARPSRPTDRDRSQGLSGQHLPPGRAERRRQEDTGRGTGPHLFRQRTPLRSPHAGRSRRGSGRARLPRRPPAPTSADGSQRLSPPASKSG